MTKLKIAIFIVIALLCATPCAAKKYKFVYGSHPLEVYTTGQGAGRTQLVKAWAVAKNADKAIEQAKMDAVCAALFDGITFDESTHGMGVSNLQPRVSHQTYLEFQTLFDKFFTSGEFLDYVREMNSAYPSGENNMAVKGGRRVGINLIIDYPRLDAWLKENHITKGVGGHFRN